MTYKINSQDGRQVNVTFTFDDKSTKTKDMDLQPYGTDGRDYEGRPIIVLKDPFEDIDAFFQSHMEALARGIAQAAIPNLVKGKHVDPAANIAKRASEDKEAAE